MASDAHKELAGLVKAIAHPTRLRILEILAEGEACVCHLTAALRQRQPYVSQHLMRLRETGLVHDRRDGALVYYSLSCPCVKEATAALHKLLRATGVEADFRPTPRVPVPGCPCPHCSEEQGVRT